MRPSEHLFDFGRPVAYYPGLVKHMGSVNAALLFCQFFYWRDKTENELGVYKSVEEIEQETGLTYREQATARRQLVERGILIETHKRLEHRIYYRIDGARLDSVLSSADCETRNSPTADSAVRGVRNAQFVPTEITTEITTESKKHKAVDLSSFPEQPSESVWNDYLKHRKAKRAPVSQTVIKSMAKELELAAAAGWSVDDALSEAMSAGWQGLKATWLISRSAPRNGLKQSSHHGLRELDYGNEPEVDRAF